MRDQFELDFPLENFKILLFQDIFCDNPEIILAFGKLSKQRKELLLGHQIRFLKSGQEALVLFLFQRKFRLLGV